MMVHVRGDIYEDDLGCTFALALSKACGQGPARAVCDETDTEWKGDALCIDHDNGSENLKW